MLTIISVANVLNIPINLFVFFNIIHGEWTKYILVFCPFKPLTGASG